MGQILNLVEQLLTEEEWKFDKNKEKQTIRCGIQGDNASFDILFIPREEKDQLRILVITRNNIAVNYRISACEFFNRANYGLIIGNFEMDMSDGEFRYRVAVDVENGQLSHTMIKNMMQAGIHMMDRYYPGIMAMQFAGRTAEEAIKQIEE